LQILRWILEGKGWWRLHGLIGCVGESATRWFHIG